MARVYIDGLSLIAGHRSLPIVEVESLLAMIKQDQALGIILPLSLFDKVEGVAVGDREVLAEDLDVFNGLVQVNVDMFLDLEDGLVSISVLQLLGQVLHAPVKILVAEGQQFELEVDFGSAVDGHLRVVLLCGS